MFVLVIPHPVFQPLYQVAARILLSLRSKLLFSVMIMVALWHYGRQHGLEPGSVAGLA